MGFAKAECWSVEYRALHDWHSYVSSAVAGKSVGRLDLGGEIVDSSFWQPVLLCVSFVPLTNRVMIVADVKGAGRSPGHAETA